MVLCLAAFGLLGCGLFPKKEASIQGLDKRTYKDDEISVTSALQMVKSSYTLGCTEAYIAQGMRGKHRYCLNQAEDHIQKDILPIFDK